MINIKDIITSSIDENLKKFIDEVQNVPHKDAFESEVRVNKALMNFSELLLKKYHEALKAELAKQGIDI